VSWRKSGRVRVHKYWVMYLLLVFLIVMSQRSNYEWEIGYVLFPKLSLL
jgi:hypothetical protein